MRNPHTPEKWQIAVDAAHGALAFQSAKLYGLVTGGPEVNTARCVEVLKAGAARGVIPSIDAIETFADGLVATQRKGKPCR